MIISYYMTDIIEVLTVIPIPVFLEGFCNFSYNIIIVNMYILCIIMI